MNHTGDVSVASVGEHYKIRTKRVGLVQSGHLR